MTNSLWGLHTFSHFNFGLCTLTVYTKHKAKHRYGWKRKRKGKKRIWRSWRRRQRCSQRQEKEGMPAFVKDLFATCENVNLQNLKVLKL